MRPRRTLHMPAPLSETRTTAPVPAAPVGPNMSLLAWILLWLIRGALGGPVQRALWSKEVTPVETKQGRTSFYRLPVYRDVEGPLVAPEVFRPVPYKVPLPAGLRGLLLPQERREQGVQQAGARAVEVRCGVGSVSVRVDCSQLGAWIEPGLFKLGSCRVSSARGRFLYFHGGLGECGGKATIVGGRLVYTYLLSYTPPVQGYVIRAPPLRLPIHCHYNRFHYSYKVGFSPQVQMTTFMKSMRSKRSFVLTVLNAGGKPMPPGHSFFLGEQVKFLAQTDDLLDGERLYVDSCYATSSKDPNGTPRLDIIAHNGCMTDSKRPGSSSKFLQRANNLLQFSVDTFLFNAVSQILYLHCAMSVGLTTSQSAKSCNYNKVTGRWEELVAPTSVCSCCDSMCTQSQDNAKSTVSSSGWIVGAKSDAKPRTRAKSFQAEDGREWVDREGPLEDNDAVEDFQRKAEIGQDEEKEIISKKTSVFPDEKRQWRHSSSVSQMGMTGNEKGETEDKIIKMATDVTADKIMADQTGPEGKEMVEASDKIHPTKKVSDGLSGENKSTDASVDDSGPTTVTATTLAVNINTSNHGSADNISTAIIPNITLCVNSDDTDCSDSAGHDTVDTAIAADSSPSYVHATSGKSDLYFGWDPIPQENLHSSGFKMSAGIHEATADSSNSGENSVESDQEESDWVSSDLLTSEKVQWQAGDTVSVKGPHEYDEMFRSLQIRELESERSADPAGFSGPICADGSVCESDLNSGAEEGEARHLSQATGETETNEEQEFAGTMAKLDNFGPVSSEKMQQDGPGQFAGMTVATPLQDPESRHMIDWEWADLLPQWDMHSLGFVVERAIQEEGGWVRTEGGI